MCDLLSFPTCLRWLLYFGLIIPSGLVYAQSNTVDYTNVSAEVWAEFIRIKRGQIEPLSESATINSRQDTSSRLNSFLQNQQRTGPFTAAPESQSSAQFNNTGQTSQDIIYTRVPRTHGSHEVTLKDGSTYTLASPDIWDRLPDTRHVFDGFNAPGQLILHRADGTEKILFDCFKLKQPCVPLDPAVSLDGQKVLFSVYSSNKLVQAKWSGTTLPNKRLGKATSARLHVVDLSSGSVSALAHTPGTMDISPAWLPDGRIMFASDRQGGREPFLDRISPNNRPDPQLYIADADATSAVNITPHEVSSAMHPYVLRSGRIVYGSQWLSHNLAYIHTNGGINWPGTQDNMWVVMDIDSRGGDMNALLGAHRTSLKTSTGRRKTMKALHFLGQRANGDICVANYYRGNNLGLGDVVCWPPEPNGIEGQLPRFLPRNIYNVADWSVSNDQASRRVNGIYQGKIGYPEGADNNQLLLTLGRGYCTQVSGSLKSFQEDVAEQPNKLACDTGIYLTTQIPSKSIDDLAKVVDRAEWHEFGARVIAPRQVEQPPVLDTSDGSCQLASSNAADSETAPYKAYKFNHNYAVSANNGGEIDGLAQSELAGIRFWEVLPNSPTKTFNNISGNRLRDLGLVPLLADKSFKVALPCDTAFIMAGIDAKGRVIKRDQVPQSLRPGEKRVCSGCHLHSRKGRPYEKSLAFGSEAIPLLTARPVPTYERCIKPIFERHCITCHVSDVPLMDYDKLVWDPFQASIPEDRRIQVSNSNNPRRKYGLQRPYTSKYINSMFARESLLYWKAANQRSDGRTDQTYADDIDFGPSHPTDITEDELRILAHWIDSGATRIKPKD